MTDTTTMIEENLVNKTVMKIFDIVQADTEAQGLINDEHKVCYMECVIDVLTKHHKDVSKELGITIHSKTYKNVPEIGNA